MATNRRFAAGSPLSVAVGSPTVSNDPVVVGEMGGGVALTDYDAATGKSTVDFDGVYDLSVAAVNVAGNVAVAAGDALYYVAADTPKLSKKATGVFFGYALEAIVSGETATIMVRLSTGSRGTFEGLGAAFVSAETTSTGSSQNIAHGLGRTPTKVVVALTEFLSSVNVDVAEGTHTSTNVVLTVVAGVKFKVLAY